jgi:hypothetical protein
VLRRTADAARPGPPEVVADAAPPHLLRTKKDALRAAPKRRRRAGCVRPCAALGPAEIPQGRPERRSRPRCPHSPLLVAEEIVLGELRGQLRFLAMALLDTSPSHAVRGGKVDQQSAATRVGNRIPPAVTVAPHTHLAELREE